MVYTQIHRMILVDFHVFGSQFRACLCSGWWETMNIHDNVKKRLNNPLVYLEVVHNWIQISNF